MNGIPKASGIITIIPLMGLPSDGLDTYVSRPCSFSTLPFGLPLWTWPEMQSAQDMVLQANWLVMLGSPSTTDGGSLAEERELGGGATDVEEGKD